MNLQKLEKLERALWRARMEFTREELVSDPIGKAVDAAWQGLFPKVREARIEHCRWLDGGQICWEVYYPGGKRFVRTPRLKLSPSRVRGIAAVDFGEATDAAIVDDLKYTLGHYGKLAVVCEEVAA